MWVIFVSEQLALCCEEIAVNRGCIAHSIACGQTCFPVVGMECECKTQNFLIGNTVIDLLLRSIIELK